ncbi:MAG: DNA-directed DNA polymerase I [Desulfurococcales archaeon]|nr:DNA-directed DNA polymerase I [Desulfurococcales archaeon]
MARKKTRTLDEFLKNIERKVNSKPLKKPREPRRAPAEPPRRETVEEPSRPGKYTLESFIARPASQTRSLTSVKGYEKRVRDEMRETATERTVRESSTVEAKEEEQVEMKPSNAGVTLPARAGEPLDSGLEVSSFTLNRSPVVEEAYGYLMDVRYDGSIGKAIVFVYDPGEERLVKWIDRSGHRPYFLTDARPEDLGETRPPITSDERVVSIETVTKFHPIKREKVKLTKIVVSDPLAVRGLRERIKEAGFNYWEADIKYHHNYVFDNEIVPGMLYHVSKGFTLEESDPESAAKLVEEVFSDETKEFQELAKNWVPIFEQPPPDIPRIAIDIEVYSPYSGELPDQRTASYPIISIALADNRGMRKVLLLARDDVETGDLTRIKAEVEIFDDERSMILEALRIISNYSVIVTFNGDNFDLPYMYNRLVSLGVYPSLLPFEFKQDYVTFTDNLHVDLHRFFDIRALQVYAFGNKYREKSLDAVAEALLGKKKVALEKPISELSLEELAHYNVRDAELTIELTTYSDNLVWNLIILLMRISKLGLEDVTRTQVSGWIKSLMNWEHRRRNYLIPSRDEIASYANIARTRAIIKDKKYQGAKVLQPPQGVFFNIYVLDFASLYPSIIKNWNLSYETVNNPYCKGEAIEIPDVGHKVCKSIQGISSQIVGLLKDFRVRIYKRRAKDKTLPATERLWYNTVQAAMKVYVNASYGVFGTESFHLYSLAVAESVTAIGRRVLTATEEKARELDLIILYGDTDSVFLWDPPEEKIDMLTRYIKEEFNLDLEKDREFKIGLFSGLKKNYIGITREGSIVIKGMVGKKSNTPEFLKNEFHRAVEMLGELEEPEDVVKVLDKMRAHVSEIYKRLKKHAYTLDELAIRVMLSKDPREYKKNTPQHVKAALLLRKNGIHVARGFIVSFVKTRDSLGVKPVKLAKLSEVDTSKYFDYVKTVFEQMLLALGVRWTALGSASLTDLLASAEG